jgi:hypothetical protein
MVSTAPQFPDSRNQSRATTKPAPNLATCGQVVHSMPKVGQRSRLGTTRILVRSARVGGVALCVIVLLRQYV